MALKGISGALFFFVLAVAATCTTSVAVAQEIDLAPAPAPTMESAAGYQAMSGAFALISLFLSFAALLWQ